MSKVIIRKPDAPDATGLQSHALLFFSWGDVIKLKGFAEVDGNKSANRYNAQKARSKWANSAI